MNRLKISLLSFVFCSLFTAAHADNHDGQNQISMQLQEEGWVSSKTAQVSVDIQVATSKNNISVLMDMITNKLKNLLKPAASWRLVDLSTEKNDAGLFAVSAQMTARLNSDQLAQLQTQIDSLNKAGEQYKISSVDYQPTLAEIALENTRLRALIYEDLLKQQQLINTALPGTNYQLQTLNFESPYVGSPHPMMMLATGSTARQAPANTSMPFSQQLILTANITFSSPSAMNEKSH